MKIWQTLWLLCLAFAPALAQAQVSLSLLNDMAFGQTEFSGTPSGNITLGTNGTLSYGGNMSGSGLGTAAQVQITGTAGTVVDISCDTTATLAKAGFTDLTLSPVKLSVATGNAYVADTACIGIGSVVASHTLTSTGSDNIVLIGGQLQTSGVSVGSGVYSAAAAGGTKVNLRVIIQ